MATEKKKVPARKPDARSPRAAPKKYSYEAGQTPRAVKALENLEQICRKHLAGRYRLVVIDLLKAPKLARGDQIVAVPTLVRKLPTPVRRIIGDLSNTERVLIGLDLRQR